jgi:hypothetical protein
LVPAFFGFMYQVQKERLLFDVRHKSRKREKSMRTLTSSEQLEAESVWGIEALDPLEQRHWVRALWRKLRVPLFVRRPLLLIFSPPAERAAIRTLNALSLGARRLGIPTTFRAPQVLPMLSLELSNQPALYEVHRASRFTDLPLWLKRAQHVEAFSVLTVPEDEYPLISGLGDWETARIPEEDAVYCDNKRLEVIKKIMPLAPERLSGVDKELHALLAEAGVAGVPMPLSLLARHLRLDGEALVDRLGSQPLVNLVEVFESDAVAGVAARIRGRWLAEGMAPHLKCGHYPALTALLASADAHLPIERFFFLTLLIALRAQGNEEEVNRLLVEFYHRFHPATVAGDRNEREAWRCFHGVDMLPLFRQ